MTTTDTRVAQSLARIACLAELLSAYAESENECWSCLQHLTTTLAEAHAELCRLLSE